MSLGILKNLDVSESALKHKQMGKNLGPIRGRQATVNALIGNERLDAYGFLFGYQSRTPSSSGHNPKIGHYLLTHMMAFWLQLPSSSSHEN